MRKISGILIYILAAASVGIFSVSTTLAQEEVYRIEYSDIFGALRRPVVEFPHEAHVETLENSECGACHHAPDPDTGKLVYMEDEEVSCVECHGADKQEDTPALREAFHGSCTVCHRRMRNRMRKSNTVATGPTTCGECHIPE